jgi:hypothetical protein
VLTGGHGARFAVGNIGMCNGEAFGITAIATDTLAISPALSAAPPTGITVYGGVNYKPLDNLGAARTLTWAAWIGGTLRQMMYGHLPGLKIEGIAQAEVPRYSFEGPIDGFTFYPTAGINWTPQQDTTMPILARVARVVLGGSSVVCMGGTFDVGYAQNPRTAVTGFASRDGNVFTDRATVGSLKLWLDEGTTAMTHVRRLQRGATMELLIQCGSAPGQTWGLWVPKLQLNAAPLTMEGQQYTDELSYMVLDATAVAVGLSDFCMTVI